MKTLISLVSGLLLTCAVAILGTAGIVGAQSSNQSNSGGANADGGVDPYGTAQKSIRTLDQLRQRGAWQIELDAEDFEWDDRAFQKPSSPPDPRKAAMSKIRELRSALNAGKDRSKVESQLRQALSEYFLADMRHRVRELDEIKAKVTKMETRLQRRLDSQRESIDLQLKLFLQEADGLGFFRPEDSVARPVVGAIGGTTVPPGSMLQIIDGPVSR